jgi:hypothetical protein
MSEPIVITFNGRIPSKKNNQRPLRRGRGMIIAASEAYMAWEKAAILGDLLGIPPIPWPRFTAEFTIFAPDVGDADLSNKWEGCADAMVKAGIIPDDNWWKLCNVSLVFGGLDRKNPRVVVLISESTKSIVGDSEKLKAQAATAKRNAKKVNPLFPKSKV